MQYMVWQTAGGFEARSDESRLKPCSYLHEVKKARVVVTGEPGVCMRLDSAGRNWLTCATALEHTGVYSPITPWSVKP